MTDPVNASSPSAPEAQAEFHTARNIYFVVFGTFVAICAVAIIVTSQQEANQTGFKAIETEQPMLFFDKTYTKSSHSTKKTTP